MDEAPGAASRLLLGGVWLYRNLISTPLHLVAGPRFGCRFYPSCSAYAAEAIRVHGAVHGADLAVRRIIKCGPWNPGGVDFVPPRGALRPRCVRAASPHAAS
ncbi:membrane protein insertion efficiency factor YidD [Opitutaceae bacterium EW11]|nr:membrane protein insertion efficiency factor YidD [Opitutaceae bacterium EW11]